MPKRAMITTEKWSRELKLNMNLVHLYKDRQCCYKHIKTPAKTFHISTRNVRMEKSTESFIEDSFLVYYNAV